MSIEENVGQLQAAIETINTALEAAGSVQQSGADALGQIQEVAGGSAPESLATAMQAISEGQHKVEEATAAYNTAVEKVNDYIELLVS